MRAKVHRDAAAVTDDALELGREDAQAVVSGAIEVRRRERAARAHAPCGNVGGSERPCVDDVTRADAKQARFGGFGFAKDDVALVEETQEVGATIGAECLRRGALDVTSDARRIPAAIGRIGARRFARMLVVGFRAGRAE